MRWENRSFPQSPRQDDVVENGRRAADQARRSFLVRTQREGGPRTRHDGGKNPGAVVAAGAVKPGQRGAEPDLDLRNEDSNEEIILFFKMQERGGCRTIM